MKDLNGFERNDVTVLKGDLFSPVTKGTFGFFRLRFGLLAHKFGAILYFEHQDSFGVDSL